MILKVWLTVRIPVHHEGWGYGQGYVMFFHAKLEKKKKKFYKYLALRMVACGVCILLAT